MSEVVVRGLAKRIELADRWQPSPEEIYGFLAQIPAGEERAIQGVREAGQITAETIAIRWGDLDIGAKRRLARLRCADLIKATLVDPTIEQTLGLLGQGDQVSFGLNFDYAFGIYRIITPLEADGVRDIESSFGEVLNELGLVNEDFTPLSLPQQVNMFHSALDRERNYRESLRKDSTGYPLILEEAKSITDEFRAKGYIYHPALIPGVVSKGMGFGVKVYRTMYPYPSGVVSY